jgi:pimeloyl-ACP methyl ester carboxylesterase
MQPCYSIEIVTPKKVILNGLWFGPKKLKRAVVWVHGLGSSMFRKQYIVDELVDRDTAVLVFNNRGHEKVSRISRVTGKSIKGGAAHEVFTECVDDIQGAINFARALGVKEIYLAGHSTGCQKTIYFISKKSREVKGAIILAPISDYASERMASGIRKMQKAEKVAREYVRRGKEHTLLPEQVWGWPWIADAQRFLSLYTGSSAEEVFTYWKPQESPKALRSVRTPTLVLLAENDEYADRPAKEIGMWFEQNVRASHRVVIVPKVGHNFKGGEKKVAAVMKEFMKEN